MAPDDYRDIRLSSALRATLRSGPPRAPATLPAVPVSGSGTYAQSLEDEDSFDPVGGRIVRCIEAVPVWVDSRDPDYPATIPGPQLICDKAAYGQPSWPACQALKS